MKIRIYRGTKEIGGTCIELTANNGKILWVDLGLPLSNQNPSISYQNNKVDALLISHSHMDHFGLMESIGSHVPVYLGQVSEDLIKATKRFLSADPPNCNFHRITPWKEIHILETFTVYPYLVDHSAPESFSFVIEADHKRIFYTGDFRSSGRKGFLFEKILSHPPENIDLLLIEGTMVERNRQQFETESEVETAITDIIRNQQNITFVVSSAQNIDRYCSVFSACAKENKMLIIDVYMAWVLEIVRKKAKGLPTIDAGRVLVYKSASQMEKVSGMDFIDFTTRVNAKALHHGMFTKPEKFVYFLRCPKEKFVDKILEKNNKTINLIYSQWVGYLQDEHKTWCTDKINRLEALKKVTVTHIHTSGHATMNELKVLAKAIKPNKTVPIHTDNPAKMKLEFSSAGINSIEIWNDGQEYVL